MELGEESNEAAETDGAFFNFCTTTPFQKEDTNRPKRDISPSSPSNPSSRVLDIDINKFWRTAPAAGWISSYAPRSYWSCPSTESNDYLRVHYNGGLNQQRTVVGLILCAMGFDNSTRIYLAGGDIFGGDRFIKPFKALFPHLENHNTVMGVEKLKYNTQGLVGVAVDYVVCLISNIFMPTYDGPSNFANNLLGHRLYHGFGTTIQHDRKALTPIFIDREEGRQVDFEERVRQIMFNTKFGGPHKRARPESFYTNSFLECFCQRSPQNPVDRCPSNKFLAERLLSSRGSNEPKIEFRFSHQPEKEFKLNEVVL